MTAHSSNTLELLLDYHREPSSQGLLLIDRSGTVRFANDPFYRLFQFGPDFSFENMSLEECLGILAPSAGSHAEQAEFLRLTRPFLDGVEHQTRLDLKQSGWISLVGRPMNHGGYAINAADVTRTRQAFDGLKRANRATVMALADLAENRDNDTGAHVLKVARMTQEIARELRTTGNGLSREIDDHFMQNVALASILHDVGKVTTPDRILLKQGPLDAAERAEMSRHADAGHSIINKMLDLQEGSHFLEIAARIARFHHEKYGGGGYPTGIAGEEIPLEARIVAVSDVFDALMSWRPYKKPWPETKAVEMIKKGAGSDFDPRVVAAFERVMRRRAATNALKWHDNMSVGVKMMDKDHQVLISLVNQLADARHRADLIIVELVIEELMNYSIRHFQNEERILEEAEFPLLTEHREQHRTLSERVESIRRKFLMEGDIAQVNELTGLLTGWLKNHILIEDKKYQRHFLNRPAAPEAFREGETPLSQPLRAEEGS